jgi:Bacterial Ig-like domain (group 1)
LTAQVTDAYGNPISGVVVTFTAPASGAGGTFAGRKTITAITNAAGIATAPAFTANAITGEFAVNVSALGLPPGAIELTNLPRPA